MVQVARRRSSRRRVRRVRPASRIRLPGAVGEARPAVGVDDATRRLLQYVVVPLWIGAGFADWACHRRTSIETTAGVQESAVHALMMTEAGIPSTLGLFLEVNAGVLAMTLAAFGLHQATAIWDVAYADERRTVTPTEQHVHGLLEQGPAMATAFLLALHCDQARALFGLAPSGPCGERSVSAVPRAIASASFASVAGLVALPYGEELLRCWRHRHRVADALPSHDHDLL
jgi:hypothetical protein